MKLAFTNVLFRHNSACVIQRWLRLKRVITVRLAYICISYAFPNGSKTVLQIVASHRSLPTIWVSWSVKTDADFL